jgi:hypothetical protein
MKSLNILPSSAELGPPLFYRPLGTSCVEIGGAPILQMTVLDARVHGGVLVLVPPVLLRTTGSSCTSTRYRGLTVVLRYVEVISALFKVQVLSTTPE